MYGGYYCGWEPTEYITEDIPLAVYESKAGKPYMNLKGWAEEKEADPARDELLKNVYLSAKMMRYHPLMTKELRKTYSLLAATAMREMTPETKFGVKKQFNNMSTALKAMRQKMKAEKALYGPINKRGFFGKIDFWNRLIALPIMILMFLNIFLAMILMLLHIIQTMYLVALLELQQTTQHTRRSLKIEEKLTDRRCSCFRIVRRIGIRGELGYGLKEENLLEIISRHLRNVLKQLIILLNLLHLILKQQ